MTTPTIVSFNDLNTKKVFATINYTRLLIKNKNTRRLDELISKKQISGVEVGSRKYVKRSNKFFIRTKALQKKSFLLNHSKEAILPIIPTAFLKQDLVKDTIIISKDSNIGETIILNKDYPNYMLCSGLRGLIPKDNGKYIFALTKHKNFKKQLYTFVKHGSTLKHAKTEFLNCLIPFPNKDANDIIKYINCLVDGIVSREVEINNKMEKINNLITNELVKNQKNKIKITNATTISNIIKQNRFDSGIYDYEFKNSIELIKNYSNGTFNIDGKKIKSGSTPKKRIFGKGKKWITPTIFDENGVFYRDSKILCENYNLTKDCAIFVNRTSKEKIGRYVGISAFYEFAIHGIGQHNQGCYRIEDYDKNTLLYIVALMNSEIYRTICSHLSLGSKMKEMKQTQFSEIPFPNFGNKIKKEINLLYYNETNITQTKVADFNKDDLKIINESGILQLAEQMKLLKKQLNSSIDKIYVDLSPPDFKNIYLK